MTDVAVVAVYNGGRLGSRRTVGLRAIGAACGVSRSTVSEALRDSPRVAAAVKVNVRAMAARMGYSADPRLSAAMTMIARRRWQDGGRSLAVISGPEGAASSPAVLYEAIAATASEQGFTVTRFTVKSAAAMSRLAGVLAARGVDGSLLVGDVPLPPEAWPGRHATVAIGVGWPGWRIARVCDEGSASVLPWQLHERGRTPVAEPDHAALARTATEMLVALTFLPEEQRAAARRTILVPGREPVERTHG